MSFHDSDRPRKRARIVQDDDDDDDEDYTVQQSINETQRGIASSSDDDADEYTTALSADETNGSSDESETTPQDPEAFRAFLESEKEEWPNHPWFDDRMKSICTKYGLEAALGMQEPDEINIRTGKVVVDRGHWGRLPSVEYSDEDYESFSSDEDGIEEDHEEDVLDFLRVSSQQRAAKGKAQRENDTALARDLSTEVTNAQLRNTLESVPLSTEHISRLFGPATSDVLKNIKKQVAQMQKTPVPTNAIARVTTATPDMALFEDDDLSTIPMHITPTRVLTPNPSARKQVETVTTETEMASPSVTTRTRPKSLSTSTRRMLHKRQQKESANAKADGPVDETQSADPSRHMSLRSTRPPRARSSLTLASIDPDILEDDVAASNDGPQAALSTTRDVLIGDRSSDPLLEAAPDLSAPADCSLAHAQVAATREADHANHLSPRLPVISANSETTDAMRVEEIGATSIDSVNTDLALNSAMVEYVRDRAPARILPPEAEHSPMPKSQIRYRCQNCYTALLTLTALEKHIEHNTCYFARGLNLCPLCRRRCLKGSNMRAHLPTCLIAQGYQIIEIDQVLANRPEDRLKLMSDNLPPLEGAGGQVRSPLAPLTILSTHQASNAMTPNAAHPNNENFTPIGPQTKRVRRHLKKLARLAAVSAGDTPMKARPRVKTRTENPKQPRRRKNKESTTETADGNVHGEQTKPRCHNLPSKTRSDILFQCPRCYVPCWLQSGYDLHLKEQHCVVKNGPIRCKLNCYAQFPTPRAHASHVKTCPQLKTSRLLGPLGVLIDPSTAPDIARAREMIAEHVALAEIVPAETRQEEELRRVREDVGPESMEQQVERHLNQGEPIAASTPVAEVSDHPVETSFIDPGLDDLPPTEPMASILTPNQSISVDDQTTQDPADVVHPVPVKARKRAPRSTRKKNAMSTTADKPSRIVRLKVRMPSSRPREPSPEMTVPGWYKSHARQNTTIPDYHDEVMDSEGETFSSSLDTQDQVSEEPVSAAPLPHQRSQVAPQAQSVQDSSVDLYASEHAFDSQAAQKRPQSFGRPRLFQDSEYSTPVRFGNLDYEVADLTDWHNRVDATLQARKQSGQHSRVQKTAHDPPSLLAWIQA